MSLSFEQKGDLRWATLRFLYENQGLAPWPEDQVQFRLTHDRRVPFAFDRQDLREGLALLQGLNLVEMPTDRLSAVRRWNITAEGVLAHEREGL